MFSFNKSMLFAISEIVNKFFIYYINHVVKFKISIGFMEFIRL